MNTQQTNYKAAQLRLTRVIPLFEKHCFEKLVERTPQREAQLTNILLDNPELLKYNNTILMKILKDIVDVQGDSVEIVTSEKWIVYYIYRVNFDLLVL